MIKPGEIQQIANKLGLRDTQIEKDYVIGWILKGISVNQYLKGRLIFKGGTALRKIYFHDYRLSEDLDFTYYGDDYDTEKIKEHFEELVEFLKEEARINLTIEDEKVHATGNYNFYLGYTGPLGGTGANKNIKVDIANDEKLCDDPVKQNLYNEYSDLNEDFSILCYTLNEIAAEKMRSLMQRTMPRDIYDIWYLLEIENQSIEDFVFNFREKAEYKNLNPDNFIETIDNKEEIFKRHWKNNLVNQVSEVPGFDEVWRQLKKHWKKL